MKQQRKIALSVMLQGETITELEKIARERDTSLSAVAREFIEAGVTA